MSRHDSSFLQEAEIAKLPDNIIIGESNAAHSLRQMAALAAGTGAPLLLTGPAGSGKEVAARAVHAASRQRNGPFVRVNCSTLGDDGLMVLFGINPNGQDGRGSQSYFEMAAFGTLFLDEIADLPLPLQAMVQQILEEKPVPGLPLEPRHYRRVRIIAATRTGLGSLIGEDQFRQDLYYSLSLLTIAVPPLRQRRGDIAMLIDYFLMPKPAAERFTLETGAMQLLETHFWPGNIRELRNVVARASLFHPGTIIGAQRMGALLKMGEPMKSHQASAEPPSNISPGFNLKAHLDEEEKRFIQTALKQTKGVVQHAANLSGLKRTTFIEKMKRHAIKRTDYRM
ncbi:MAG: sigma 54-interacting transcriptional regulator [Sphingomonadales bacterium]|nr:sigma 54-interacting transcriptional regulator [Sphingomonadales bacterium]